MRDFVISSIIATACYIVAFKSDLPSWLTLFLVVVGIIFSVVAVVCAIEYLDSAVTEHLRARNMALIEPTILGAQAVKGCSPAELDYLARVALWDITAVWGSDDIVIETLRLPGCDMPMGLVETFLRVSQDTEPHLCPVSHHDSVVFKDYVDVEKKLTIFTKTLIRKGWCEEAAGPYSARLKQGKTLEQLADVLGVEL